MLKDHKLHLTIVIFDTQIDILNYLYLYLDLYWLSHTKAVENETVFHSPENAVQAAGGRMGIDSLNQLSYLDLQHLLVRNRCQLLQ